MTYIQNLFTSRDNNADGATYVGQEGRLWWNPDTNAFYYSDGNTAGGNPITVTPNSNVTFNVVTANTLTSPAGTLNLTGNINITGNISPAASNKIGGIAPGPGVVIGTNGILTIDSANLPVSFGNFFANNNILSIVNVNEDMILATDGSAEIQLIGNVGFYKPDGLPPNVANRYASFSNDGQVTILVPTTDLDSAVKIVGSTTGAYIAPGIEGAMLHITGQLDVPSRAYYDGNGDYVAWVARRWNGNVAVPTQVLANEDVLRINATAATDAGVGNVAMAQIQFRALQDQTTTAQGSTINFVVTPVGSSAASRVEVANVTVANGFTATKFTTAGTVSATGNVSGGNLTTAGLVTATANIAGGNLLTTGLISATGNITGGNVAATNYTGQVTHTVRDAGAVGGTTLTLNVTTDDIVKCTFSDNFTVAFSSIIPGRVVTLLATNSSAGDTDIVTAGISAVNMQGDNTLTVTQQTTSVITYYSTGTTTGNIFASAVYS
jgi:hypothetical protein